MVRGTLRTSLGDFIVEADNGAEIGAAVAAYELKIRAHAEAAKVPMKDPSPPTVDPDVEERRRWLALWSQIHDKPDQLKLVEYLKANPGPIALHELAKAVGVENTVELSGRIGGVRKNTLKAGYGDVNAIIARLKSGHYRAGKALRANAIPKTIWQHIEENFADEP